MKIIKENIDKISLGELGLVNHDEKRIWGAMLPEIRKHLDGESSIFDGIQCNHPFEGFTEAERESDLQIHPWKLLGSES